MKIFNKNYITKVNSLSVLEIEKQYTLFIIVNNIVKLFLVLDLLNPTTKEYSSDDVVRATICFFLSSFLDEENQVSGCIYFMDIGGYSMKHQTFFCLDDIKRNTNMWQVYIDLYLHFNSYLKLFP